MYDASVPFVQVNEYYFIMMSQEIALQYQNKLIAAIDWIRFFVCARSESQQQQPQHKNDSQT